MTAAVRPQVGAATPWSFPAAAEHTLSNGAGVALFHLPGQHVISTRIVIEAPLAAEPRDREGVATIVSRTMDEGTAVRSADQMAETLERAGIALSAGMLGAGMLVDLDATARNAELGWALAAEFLAQPAFDESEVHRHVRQRLAEIEQDLADPAGRAVIEWAHTFYTDRSRASRPSGGRAATVEAITGADARAFHGQTVRPGRATVVVAGDLDERQTLDQLEATLGAWQDPGAAPVAGHLDVPADQVRPDVHDKVTFVHRPGAVQTQLYLGALGPDRRDELGWAPYAALGFLIGGSPNSRLDAVLREEKGYTYGIHAAYRPRSHDGVMSVAGSVRGDATAESLELVLQILNKIEDGFGADELAAAVDFIGKTAPIRYATADVVAGEAGALYLDRLGTDFVTEYLAALKRLTTDDLMGAWSRWQGAPRSIVLVGDAEAWADQVASIAPGGVDVVDGSES